MKSRTVRNIIPARRVSMDGKFMDQPLPVEGIDYIDPFLLIHHWDYHIPKGAHPRDTGVGPHPHRGFSPVTYIYEGDIEHRDSHGNHAIVKKGGTQWMHAGKGITHSERHSKELVSTGGKTEFVQFWINSPAAYKMEVPYYLPLSDEDTPKIIDDGVKTAVIAGTYQDVKGPANTYSPLLLLRISAIEGAKFSIPVPSEYNALIYIVKGRIVTSENKRAFERDLIWYHNDGESIHVEAKEDAEIMLLAGEPIGEEIVQYGPFVMNDSTEIMEAMRDAQLGKMGILIEDF